MATGEGLPARLWDAPVRIAHWALAALVGFAWWSAQAEHMDWHRWSGYAIVGLLAFRLVWGLVGSQSARFASFVRGPGATLAYLKTLPRRGHADMPGHNPLGALSILALLAVMAVQVVTGLFAVDVDAIEAGPLSDRVSFDTGRMLAHWHHLSFTALEALIALHLAAVGFYLIYKRSNLIGPMITGRRLFAADPRLRFAPGWRAWVVALLSAGFAWWISRGLRF